MTANNHQLGNFITRHRKALDLSLPRLAEQVGASKGLVYAWEQDAKTPGPKYLQRLATALHVDFEDLFALADYASPDSLPALPIYLRKKHLLTKSDAERVERYVERIKGQKGRRS